MIVANTKSYIARWSVQKDIQEIVAKRNVAWQIRVSLAKQYYVVDGEEASHRFFGIECIARQKRGFGHGTVSRLKHEPVIVDTGQWLFDLLWVQAYMHFAANPFGEASGDRHDTIAAEHNVLVRCVFEFDRQGRVQTFGAHQLRGKKRAG